MQKAIELILARQLASCLAMPVFLVDTEGNLIYFNEIAEPVLGKRFEETGTMPPYEWSRMFQPCAEDGSPLDPDELPLVIALKQQRPAHRRLWILGMDGIRRAIEVTALPILSQERKLVGAVAMFWEVPA